MANSIQHMYQAYYHHFPHYMLTKTESVMLHFFLISFFLFVGYGLFSYVPGQLIFVGSRGYYYLYGSEQV
ncbi:hypothetical protein CAAN1_09S00254 [[Candida] anglica]|uniref:Uncharacterized protein n=1 Tax=[Candida] anglica TaxID=148631 RepID=A0ABP0EAR1_9ASCO